MNYQRKKKIGLFLSNGEVTLKQLPSGDWSGGVGGLFLSNGEVTLKLKLR